MFLQLLTPNPILDAFLERTTEEVPQAVSGQRTAISPSPLHPAEIQSPLTRHSKQRLVAWLLKA